MKHLLIGGAALLIMGAAQSQQPAMTVQQQFEAGSAALSEKRWEEAVSVFSALEERLSTGNHQRSLAIVRVRKGEALLKLGREDEALGALAAGLPHLPAADATLAEDRYLAALALAQISENTLDFGGAATHYRIAEAAAPQPLGKIKALAGLVRASMFHDAETALADVDRMAAAVAAAATGDKTALASVRTLRGRVLLNLGRFAEARKELKGATDDLGGLSLKVDRSDLAARADLALAALLLGDEEDARRYLAYSGAGRTRNEFAMPANAPLPACDEAGLSPEDVAVVELSISEDGTVRSASPVYSSRQGEAALAFARASLNWSWTPKDVAEIEPLFRHTMRVEMRCSTAVKRPPVIAMLAGDVEQWLAGRQVAPPVDLAERPSREIGAAVNSLLELEGRGEGASLTAIPLLISLATAPATPNDERSAYYSRALAIAEKEAAPAAVLAYLAVGKARTEEVRNATRRSWRASSLSPLLSNPAIAADARAAAALRLIEADRLGRASKRQEAKAFLTAVRDTPGLDAHDPLRVGALLRLASMELGDGNETAARAAYDATGLTAQQCALVDARPDLQRSKASSAFPHDALRWGFEGWAMSEFDVAPDGKTQNVRTVIAYPPFVFKKATDDLIGTARYSQTYRPEGGLGCGGISLGVSFRLPD